MSEINIFIILMVTTQSVLYFFIYNICSNSRVWSVNDITPLHRQWNCFFSTEILWQATKQLASIHTFSICREHQREQPLPVMIWVQWWAHCRRSSHPYQAGYLPPHRPAVYSWTRGCCRNVVTSPHTGSCAAAPTGWTGEQWEKDDLLAMLLSNLISWIHW